MPDQETPRFDLEAYLARIGLAHEPGLSPTIETLQALHVAHRTHIPFENLDVLLGRPIALDLPSLTKKLVRDKRGGYCFEQNLLFLAALTELGFHARLRLGRVRWGAAQIRPRTHTVLAVAFDDRTWLADVGFGGPSARGPIRLAEGAEVVEEFTTYRIRREREEGAWVCTAYQKDAAPLDLYAFTEEAQYPVDLEVANHYTSTYPTSFFRQLLIAQIATPEGRIALRDTDLEFHEAGSVRKAKVETPEALLDVLAREFGLALPPGTRFPQPMFGP